MTNVTFFKRTDVCPSCGTRNRPAYRDLVTKSASHINATYSCWFCRHDWVRRWVCRDGEARYRRLPLTL